MNISIFGLGYVGCVSMGCLAKNGHKVIGIDINKNKIDLINRGLPTIIEKDIDEIISDQSKKRMISATIDYIEAVNKTNVSIICVGTQATLEGHLNLDYVFKTANNIGEALRGKKGFHVIVIRSTVFPGTNYKVGKIIEKISGKNRNNNFAVVSNPEFLREGSAVQDFFNPPVIVLGSDNIKALEIMKIIYRDINAPIEIVESKIAEIIKYANNSFHALKICFANEIGNICKKLNIDSHRVMELFCMDKQLNLSSYYLKPGFAYGGSCLPKDLKALNTIAQEYYLDTPVLGSIEQSNELQKKIAFNMINSIESKNIGIIGLTFKKDTDDIRNSPTVDLVKQLIGEGFKVLIYDKSLNLSEIIGTNKEYIEKNIPHIKDLISDDLKHVVNNSDVIVIAQKFNGLNEMINKYTNKKIIDFVRISNQQSNGNYYGICW